MKKTTKPRLVRLDLGSGLTPRRGFTGIDLTCGKRKMDRVNLFTFPWPWEDDSVDEVWCSHFFEHMPMYVPTYVDGEWKGDGVYPRVQFMDELWRILKPGATATIVHPSAKSERAFQDPTHLGFNVDETWLYANREWRESQGLDHRPYPECDFEVAFATEMHPTAACRNGEVQGWWRAHLWNSTGDVVVRLTVPKGS